MEPMQDTLIETTPLSEQSSTEHSPKRFFSLPAKDWFILFLLWVLAGCGLIYEYLLSHYAARVLGLLEPAIYGMIGVMIVAMGVGSLLARWIKQPVHWFAWLEWAVATLGTLSILVIGFFHGLTYLLPGTLKDIFLLPADMNLNGGVFLYLQQMLFVLPFFLGFILGVMIGMEIPLLARIRQTFYKDSLSHNTGTLYGVDYIGAGLGALIWVVWMLSMPIMQAATLTASVNAAVGFIFTLVFWKDIKRPVLFLVMQLVLVFWILILFKFGDDWLTRMTTWLYQDKVVYSEETRFQHFLITERKMKSADTQPSADLFDSRSLQGQFAQSPLTHYRMYLNGRLQFSTEDEHIYHAFLVTPALAAAEEHKTVLVLGGGDGLALRDVLKWGPDRVDLVDLDQALVDFFSGSDQIKKTHIWPVAQRVQLKLLEQNEQAFSDPRVRYIAGNAFTEIDRLYHEQMRYDVVLVDLPDPNHPDLNKLYSDHFYYRVKRLLNSGGALAVQSTSPYHARRAFLSIGKTLESVGFVVDAYHANVPSFGEWGWHVAVTHGLSARDRLRGLDAIPVDMPWVDLALLESAFHFPKGFYEANDQVVVNKLGSHQVYLYHKGAWEQDIGIGLN